MPDQVAHRERRLGVLANSRRFSPDRAPIEPRRRPAARPPVAPTEVDAVPPLRFAELVTQVQSATAAGVADDSLVSATVDAAGYATLVTFDPVPTTVTGEKVTTIVSDTPPESPQAAFERGLREMHARRKATAPKRPGIQNWT